MTSTSSGRPGRAVRVRCAIATLVSSASFVAPAVLAQQPQVAALDTVVVTANRTPEPLSTVLADISVVDRVQIERSGATGVADLLARLPGIEFTRNGGPGTSTSVFIRGAEARHTAVYIDGMRLDSQSVGGAVWEQIPLDQIERIEVLRGPAAAVYGSDAIAGVVQLFTKRGDGPPRPTASILGGSYGTGQVDAGISGSTQGFDYALSGAYGQSDGFDATKPGAYGHNPDKDGWERSSVRGRVGYQINPEHRIEASVLASKMKSGYDGSPTTDDQNHNTLVTGTLSWQGRWNADATTRLLIGETKSTYETQPSFYRTETTLRDYTLQHDQRIGSGNVLSATLERREDELLNPATAFAATLEGKRHQDAIGVGWRGDFGAHGVQAHVRHDDDSEFGGKTTGSLAWGWGFAPQWRVTASAATSFRVPTLYQRFSQYGNPSLVPESGRNVEMGLRWASGVSEANLVGWRNKVENLISFGSPGPCASAFGCYVNVGRATLDGVTLSARTQVANVTLRGSLDWHDPRNDVNDKVLQRRAKRLGTFGAETEWGGWIFGAEVQAAGERFEDVNNTQRLGGYALVNLIVSKPLMPGLTLEGRIDNLGDKNYELARYYATPGLNGQVILRWAMP